MIKLKEFEQFIIGHALAEIKDKKDVPIVIEKVKGSAVGINKKAMEVFLHLVKSKEKLILK